ncbi:hypothetical protein CNMCM6936_008161 [Aspergillus lentulus]|nr:hypothetical protein CNMCM6936_008161 [Aspergillus lentulus]
MILSQTPSFTAGAEGYCAPNVEPVISKLPSIQDDPEFEVYWEQNDIDNPRLWPLWYKGVTVAAMSLGATVVSLSSTLYTSGIPGLQEEFGISKLEALVGVTTYLLGMALGSVLFAPLSELVGRRPVYIISMTVFLLLLLPSALARNIETILVSRFFGGFFGSALMSNSPASVNDIVSDEHRALAFGFWSIGPTNGPVYGPIIGGFVFEHLGWRWTNWIVLIIGGGVLALMASIKETYAPVILRRRAERKRKETQSTKWWTRYDGAQDFVSSLRTSLSRPFIMLLTEPICIFWDVYVALVYGVLYLCFVAYPIAFQQERGWSPGIGGLSFVDIGVGVLIAIACEPIFRKVINLHRKSEDGMVEPEAMVSIVGFGATLLAVGQLWFSWTCTPNVHWIVPILAGVPFGAGNACVFIYASNYLARSYGIYAASALAGNMLLRSIVGACLPLAGTVRQSLVVESGSTLSKEFETKAKLSVKYAGVSVSGSASYSQTSSFKSDSVYGLWSLDQKPHSILLDGDQTSTISEDFLPAVRRLPSWKPDDSSKSQHEPSFRYWATPYIKECYLGGEATVAAKLAGDPQDRTKFDAWVDSRKEGATDAIVNVRLEEFGTLLKNSSDESHQRLGQQLSDAFSSLDKVTIDATLTVHVKRWSPANGAFSPVDARVWFDVSGPRISIAPASRQGCTLHEQTTSSFVANFVLNSSQIVSTLVGGANTLIEETTKNAGLNDTLERYHPSGLPMPSSTFTIKKPDGRSFVEGVVVLPNLLATGDYEVV